jgi:hypothetical protein
LCFGLLAIGSIVCCAVFTRAALVPHCPITLVPNFPHRSRLDQMRGIGLPEARHFACYLNTTQTPPCPCR